MMMKFENVECENCVCVHTVCEICGGFLAAQCPVEFSSGK